MSQRRVRKYPLCADKGVQDLSLAQGAKFLKFAYEAGRFFAYFEEVDGREKKPLTVAILPACESAVMESFEHLGSVSLYQSHACQYVWHLYSKGVLFAG